MDDLGVTPISGNLHIAHNSTQHILLKLGGLKRNLVYGMYIEFSHLYLHSSDFRASLGSAKVSLFVAGPPSSFDPQRLPRLPALLQALRGRLQRWLRAALSPLPAAEQ